MADQLFNFNDISDFLASVGNAVSQKAAASKETALVAQTESQHVADVAGDYSTEANKAIAKLTKVESAQAESARLAESNNIFDRISLIGAQIINPRDYTHEGRSNQVAEISQDLSVRGQIANIDASASQARINAAQAREAVQTVDLDTGLLKMKTQVDALALSSQAIAQVETIRQQKLITMDAPVLNQALVGPTGPDGKIELGGMKYTPLEIRERALALDHREKVSLLSPQANDPDYASKLAVQHGLALATYSLPELEALKANGYKMPDGTQVQTSVWDAEYIRKNQLQADALTKQVNESITTQLIPTALSDAGKLLKSGEKYVTPGTPLANAANAYKAAMQTIVVKAAADETPAGKEIQLKAMQISQDAYVKAVRDEASRKAAGDTDLSSIYASQMLGEPINPGQVQDVVVARFIKHKGFGDFLPSDTARDLQKAAEEEVASLTQQQAQVNAGGLGTSKSEKDIREEAARNAFDRVASKKATDAVNVIQNLAAQRADHPARLAGIPAGAINEITRRATSVAIANVAEAEKLTPDQIQAVMAGRPMDAGLTGDRASQVAQEINAEMMGTEYDLFEAQKPGLGYQIQQWYTKNMGEMARNYTMTMDPMDQATLGDSVVSQASQFTDMYTTVDEHATSRAADAAATVAVGAKKPLNFWPVMLEMDPQLADSQKQQIFYDVITPSLQQSVALNLNPQQTMENVYTAIAQFKSGDPVLDGAVKNFSRNLPKSLDSFDKTWRVLSTQGALEGKTESEKAAAAARNKVNPEAATKHLQAILPWLTRADGSQN